MSDEAARAIFLEIRERPYRVMQSLDDVDAPNCYIKNRELLQRLGVLGYTVRGRVAPFHWEDIKVPADVWALYPGDLNDTHFYVEILQDGQWRALDSSFDSALEKHGFDVCSWENGKICFPITRVFSDEEQIAYVEKWFKADLALNYFARAGVFLKHVNAWLASLR